MSISRGSGAVETSSAIEISSSVVLPRAESTATTRWPCSRAATIRRAARLMRSASATDVPPNFITTVPDTRGSLGGSTRGHLDDGRSTGPIARRLCRRREVARWGAASGRSRAGGRAACRAWRPPPTAPAPHRRDAAVTGTAAGGQPAAGVGARRGPASPSRRRWAWQRCRRRQRSTACDRDPAARTRTTYVPVAPTPARRCCGSSSTGLQRASGWRCGGRRRRPTTPAGRRAGADRRCPPRPAGAARA